MNIKSLIILATATFALFVFSCQSFSSNDIPTFHNTNTILNDNAIKKDETITITEVVRNSRESVHLIQVTGEVKPHYHSSHWETVYILSGAGVFTARQGSKIIIETVVKPGDIYTIPAGAVHAFYNRGESPTIALSIFTPPFDDKDRVFIEK